MARFLALVALVSCALGCSSDEGGVTAEGGPPGGSTAVARCEPSCDGAAMDPPGPTTGGSSASSSSDAGSAPASRCVSPPACVCTASGDCEEALAVTTAAHREGDIDYADPPPAGGAHNGCWGAFGVHDTPLPPERFVHNLEHGAVALLYHCPDGCADDVAELEAFVRQRSFALLTEYPDLPTRFAAVAWGYRLRTDTLDLEAFAAFYAVHADHALESSTSAPPASCP